MRDSLLNYLRFKLNYKQQGEMNEDQALIEELCARFYRKPRKCKKINDSNIGSAQRIVCVDGETFYYFPKIQQFQDLDFDKLQYVVPKAGVELADILQLKFPPRRQNQRNFFSITLPKNRILKFTKTRGKIIVDEFAEGEQEWTFCFDYDIVALPIRERKLRQAQQKEQQNERLRMLQAIKLKQKSQKEKEQKIKQQITSLNQAQQLRSGATQNQEYFRKRQQNQVQQETKKRINQTDELFFHYHYRKLLAATTEKTRIEQELVLLEQVGKFRIRAQETVKEFVDEMSFSPIKIKYGVTYHKNNMKLKFGEKSLNQEFIANYCVANSIYDMRKEWTKELRVPLKALIKYKGFKILVCAMTPLDFLPQQKFDDAIQHGHSSDNWKIDFQLVQNLTLILNHLKLKPYFSEVHYQKVQIHLGSSLKLLLTDEDPYAEIKEMDPNSFQQSRNYNIIYFYDIDEVFPIDLDFNRSINQENIRLRPEFIQKYIQLEPSVAHLSAGSLTYAIDDEEGEKEDINVARASKILKVQEIVRFAKKFDSLEIIVSDSRDLSTAMKKNGINMKYLGRIIKLTQLPYVRAMAEIEGVARVVRTLYREHQKQFCLEHLRNQMNLAPLIQEAFDPRVNAGMRKIRVKQLRLQQDRRSRMNAADFLNLMFGTSQQFSAFWAIIRQKVRNLYQFQMKDPQNYHHGYLLRTILYHCGIRINITDKIRLFFSETPFSLDDILEFTMKSQIYDFPAMSVHKLTSLQGVQGKQRVVTRLQLALQIKRALGEKDTNQLLQLSRYQSKIGPPPDKFSLESFYYYLYHPTPDNFQTIHQISQIIFPSSHPAIMQMYLEYAKIKQLDPIILKRAAENHAIRNLGISHWKTSEILSNFKESEYINHLIKAEAGVKKEEITELYLAIVRELTRFGKLYESLNYVNRAIYAVEKMSSLSMRELENYFQILLKGLENHYMMRTIEQLLRLSEILYNSLTKSNIPLTSKWYEWLLYYTLKGFLESSKKKYYLFKLILVFHEQKKQALGDEQKKALLQQMGVRWKQSRNHINYIKQMLIKLQFGFTEINYLPDFFGKFYQHIKRLKNEDFNEALKEYQDMYLIFGFKYFEDALLENFFAFEKHREPLGEI